MGNRSPNHKRSVRAWEERNRPARRAIGKRWRQANPERQKRMARNTALKRRFGITIEQYEEKLASQGGKCAICGTDKPSGRGCFHVDHDHITGVVRSLLCHHCNVGLGAFRDDANLLQKALDYLRPPRGL